MESLQTSEPAKKTRKKSKKTIHDGFAGSLLRALLAFMISFIALSGMPVAARVAPTVEAESAAATALSVEERFGVAHSHLPLYDTPTLENNLDPLQAAGIGWARSVFAWIDMEYQQGLWDFSKFDNYVDMAADHGVEILGILLTSPGWANGGNGWNYPPTDMAAWADYVRRVVTRYRGRVSAWEVWNEENIEAFWPSPSVDAYMSLLRLTSTVIREADPAAKIVMGGVAGTDPDWLRNCLAAGAGDYVDAVAYHPYPEGFGILSFTPQENTARIVLENARQTVAEYSSNPVEIWLTEFGWTTSTTVPPGVDEATQGAYMLRTLITYADTTVDRVFYYKNWDDLALAWWPDYCYGLLRNDFSPKPAYHFYQRFMESFGTSRGQPAAAISYSCGGPSTLEAHALEAASGTLALAVWKSDDASDTVSLTVDSPDYLDPVSVDLMTGERTPVAGVSRDASGNITVEGLTAGKLPVILEFESTAPPPVGSRPLLDSIAPAGGYPGELVTLTGEGFGTLRDTSRVLFGTAEATIYETWSDGSIRCAVPSLAPGEVRVTVETAYGISASRAFEVTAAPSPSWCLAEGSTDGGMETWVLVQNPGTSPVDVSLTLQTGAGPLAPDTLQNVSIAGGSRTSFRLNDYCTTYDVSTLVSSTGAVVAERATYGPDRAWAHDSVGVAAPASSWCLAEGSTDGGMETWVLVQNPGTSPVDVSLTLQTGAGPLAPDTLQNVSIAGGSRTSFRLNDYCTTYDVSTLVSSSGAVVAERATYGPDRAWAHDSVGVAAPASSWCLAEGSTDGGMETWVLVQNPGTSPVDVSLTLQTGAGPLAPDTLQNVSIAGGSRTSFRLNDYCTTYDVSTLVSSTGAVVAERATYGPGTGLGPRLGGGGGSRFLLVSGRRVHRRGDGDLGAGAESRHLTSGRQPDPADRGRPPGPGYFTECKYCRGVAHFFQAERLLHHLRRLHPGLIHRCGGGGASHLRPGEGLGPRLGGGGKERLMTYVI